MFLNSLNLIFVVQAYTQSVDEDTAISTVLLTVAATDGDSSDTADGQIKYSLPSNPSEFEIKYAAQNGAYSLLLFEYLNIVFAWWKSSLTAIFVQMYFSIVLAVTFVLTLTAK